MNRTMKEWAERNGRVERIRTKKKNKRNIKSVVRLAGTSDLAFA